MGVSVFRYKVCNKSSTPVPPVPNCVQAMATVTVVASPTAVADAGETTRNHLVTVDVVGNDLVGNAPLDRMPAGSIPGTASVNPTTGAITSVPAASRLCGHDGDFVPGVQHVRIVRNGNVDGEGGECDHHAPPPHPAQV